MDVCAPCSIGGRMTVRISRRRMVAPDTLGERYSDTVRFAGAIHSWALDLCSRHGTGGCPREYPSMDVRAAGREQSEFDLDSTTATQLVGTVMVELSGSGYAKPHHGVRARYVCSFWLRLGAAQPSVDTFTPCLLQDCKPSGGSPARRSIDRLTSPIDMSFLVNWLRVSVHCERKNYDDRW